MRNVRKAALIALIAYAIICAAIAAAGETEQPAPNPRYEPGEVVRIQLEALQRNDIEVTFGFASPANREQTGPLERFVQMINGPLYSPMIGSVSIEYYPAETRDSLARQRVRIVGQNGEEIVYVFYLSKQASPPYENCWMTDAVIIEEWKDGGVKI